VTKRAAIPAPATGGRKKPAAPAVSKKTAPQKSQRAQKSQPTKKKQPPPKKTQAHARAPAPAKRQRQRAPAQIIAEVVDSIPPTNFEVRLDALPGVRLTSSSAKDGGQKSRSSRSSSRALPRDEGGVEVVDDDDRSDWEEDEQQQQHKTNSRLGESLADTTVKIPPAASSAFPIGEGAAGRQDGALSSLSSLSRERSPAAAPADNSAWSLLGASRAPDSAAPLRSALSSRDGASPTVVSLGAPSPADLISASSAPAPAPLFAPGVSPTVPTTLPATAAPAGTTTTTATAATLLTEEASRPPMIVSLGDAFPPHELL
jgi:hypothetical protein